MPNLNATEDLAIEAHDFDEGETLGRIDEDGTITLCKKLDDDPNIGVGHIHALQRRGRVIAIESKPSKSKK